MPMMPQGLSRMIFPHHRASAAVLPGSTHWKTVKAGESFKVPAHSKFDLVIREFADYCCSYL